MTPPSRLAPVPCSDAPVWNVWLSAFYAPALAIADELGLFTALAARPATPQELALQLGIELRAVESIAGVLTALELLVQLDGRIHLTETARTYLVPGSPYYWGAMLRRMRDIPLDYQKLLGSLRRGTAAADARVTAMWQRSAPPPPEVLVRLTHAMHAHSFSLAMRTLPGYDLAGVRRLLDVGGGSGAYTIAAALHHPELRCVVLDLPPVCGVAGEYMRRFGVDDRVELVPADMFVDPWPEGCDRILLSDIFHDWDDATCGRLAARAHDALPPGGRILVHEMVLADSKDGPLPAAAYSMIMLFSTQGRQRSAGELREILASAGFGAIEHAPTSGGYALVSGTKM